MSLLAVPNDAMVAEYERRPYWSVMVPTYDPDASYLEQALQSVLAQDPGCGEMQIMVIDDASPDVNTERIVRSAAGDRVQFVRNEKNLGLAGCWNRCIECARGRWVHIFHQDDSVLPGFYQRLRKAASEHPQAQLIATRSFEVDGAGIIMTVTPRVPQLEQGGRSVSDFFYANPLRCPAVVVSRDFYQRHGGFRSDLTFALDWEMWTRAIAQGGGVILPDVLTAYRFSGKNEAARLLSTAEAFKDRLRLAALFGERYADFSPQRARREICREAIARAHGSREAGDAESAAANLSFWKRHATLKQKCLHMLSSFVRRVLN